MLATYCAASPRPCACHELSCRLTPALALAPPSPPAPPQEKLGRLRINRVFEETVLLTSEIAKDSPVIFMDW